MTIDRHLVALVVIGLAVGVAPSAASAGDDLIAQAGKSKKKKKPRGGGAKTKADREADRHFKTGVELFDERKYAEALAEFEQAYALQPHPLVLYNLAGAHRALSQYDQAVDFYNRFLIEGPGKVSEAQLARGREELDDLIRLVARVDVTTKPEGAQVLVDGRTLGDTPLTEALILGPGDHTVRATLDGHEPAERKIRVAAGDTLRVEFALEPVKVEAGGTVEAGGGGDTGGALSAEPERRRFGVSASYGTNALEVTETGAPVVGVGFAINDRFSAGVDVVITALAAVPGARYRLLGNGVSMHVVVAVPITFRDGGESDTFAAIAGGLGVRYLAMPALAFRVEAWVSYAGSERGTTVPAFAGAELWF